MHLNIVRLRTRIPSLLGAAVVAVFLGCGSGDSQGPNAIGDRDSLAPGDSLGGPDSIPQDSLAPNPDTLPTPPDSVPTPDSLPDPDSLPSSDTLPAPEHVGVPFGPFGLWQPNTSIDERIQPFTGSHNFTHPDSILLQLNAARARSHRLILNMTGGLSERYTTDGKFDLVKWRARMDRFNTAEIREAVARAVADGTVIGNSVIDEPETRQWGGIITKQMLDEMGAYVKAIFPTLPVGVDHGPAAFQWRSSERYHLLDYVIYQYAWWVTTGNVQQWREIVEGLAEQDGVALGFSLNIVNGGVQDRQDWECRGTGGRGSRYPNCQVTSEQLRDWIGTLGTDACVVLLWRYHEDFLSRQANQEVLRDLAGNFGRAPKKSCRRP